MGTVFRKTATKAIPTGAKIIVREGQRLAQWKPTKGKARTAPVTVGKDGSERIVITARTFTAKYRDGSGVVCEVATGCRDEAAARSVLADLERRAEKVRGGILSPAESGMIDHRNAMLTEHFAGFRQRQEAKGVTAGRVRDTMARLERIATDCRFQRLGDIAAEPLERWYVARKTEGMGAATWNEYRGAWVTFAHWCMESGRLLSNPFLALPRANVKTDCRRKRRALTEAELGRLMRVATLRPLAEYGRPTIARPCREGQRKRSAWTYAPLTYADLEAACERARQRLAKSPDAIGRLERLGRERALIYRTLVLTGLRRGELASLTVGQVRFDAEPPYLELKAADEKNREGNSIPLRADLAADLCDWLATKAAAAWLARSEVPTIRFDPQDQQAARRNLGPTTKRQGQSCQQWPDVPALPADASLFDVPAGLVRILDRDLAAAGIAKRDERGRTVDVHAMRHTFGTLLSKGGVAPRTAQAAMRHSKLELTMNVYTDPKLLDVAGAMNALPALPLGDGSEKARDIARRTGTDDLAASEFAPAFAPTVGKPAKSVSIHGTSARWEDRRCEAQETQETPRNIGASAGSDQWAMRDSDPRPPRCKRGALTN